MTALKGRSVVITRGRTQAGSLAEALAACGAVPVFFPVIEIRPLEDFLDLDLALSQASSFDWVVFTSVNTVTAVWDRVHSSGRRGLGTRIAAVGPATRAALIERGATVEAMPTEFRGAGIPAAMGPLQGCRVLLPRSDIGREETGEALQAAGARVDQVVAYRTVPATPDPEGLATLERGVDVVTFTSPSTVRNFAALVGPVAPRLLRDTVVACIGPVTAATVTEIGLGRPLVAATSTTSGLLDILETHFATSGARR